MTSQITNDNTPPKHNERRLEGRTALITGASRGLGRAVAMAFAREGAHIIATARRVGALEDLDDAIKAEGLEGATLIPLDLTKSDRVDELGPALHQRFGHIDILVGNAGLLGPLSPLGHIKADIWEMIINVNLNANWRLIRTLDPLLKQSTAGRAVFVTSGAAQGKYAYWGPYAVSKAGLEALAKTYALEVQNEKIRCNLVNPGPLRTAMREKAFPGEDPLTVPLPEDMAGAFVELCSADCDLNGATVDGRQWLATHSLSESIG
ncbi:MAG: SDR family NAD(P)-dependent oxidoreductase [Pseudomonadota bacterium]